jgi:hypothetical protein
MRVLRLVRRAGGGRLGARPTVLGGIGHAVRGDAGGQTQCARMGYTYQHYRASCWSCWGRCAVTRCPGDATPVATVARQRRNGRPHVLLTDQQASRGATTHTWPYWGGLRGMGSAFSPCAHAVLRTRAAPAQRPLGPRLRHPGHSGPVSYTYGPWPRIWCSLQPGAPPWL